MNTCDNCTKKDVCNKICPNIEAVLSADDEPLYRVKFFDPFFIEQFFVVIKQDEIEESKRVILLKRLLKKFFKKLTKRQKKCVSLYFGMVDNEAYTQEEIAQMLHIKRHTVSYHIAMGKKKLQKLIANSLNTRLFL